MTFRPSDDVLDSVEISQQEPNHMSNENGSSDSGSAVFSNPDSKNSVLNADVSGNSQSGVNAQAEGSDFTVDLSEIGKNKGENSSNEINNIDEQKNNVSATDGGLKQNEQDVETGENMDKEREEIVSGIQGSIHSKLDFLVDDEWKSVVEKYRKIYRIIFRWGVFGFVTILGVISGIMVQVKANQSGELQLVTDETIGNINEWRESNIDKILSSQISEDYDIQPIVSYGSISFTDKSFQSKSNLIKYQGIVLPQLISLDLGSTNFVSLDKFADKETTREDIENMVKYLITDSKIYRKVSSLPNVQDSRWKGKTFEGGLIEAFGLGCVKSEKVSDFICDKLLDKFYEYGKYYDLGRYSSDVSILAGQLSKQGKDITPICKMIPEYIWRSGVISNDILKSVMTNHCSADDQLYYTNIKDFIDIDNSLKQTELSDNVFDDPDLNAYKLLSAQQIVYRLLSSSSINEGFIKSYFTFVQNLLNKDKGTGKYLNPIYKDILYVFNEDVLRTALNEKGYFNTKLPSQIDQINNGNLLSNYLPLTSQLTTPNIVKSTTFTGIYQSELTIEEIFSKYYGMTNRLQIRRATKISDTDMRVQTEIYSNDIFKVTGGETLKATIVLHRKLNVLYVDSIRISNQNNFSEILNNYAAVGNISFDDMLGYIDEQVLFWYEKEKPVEGPSLCDKLGGRSNIELYTCDETSILLYKGDIEYAFNLLNGILDLDSFVVSDPEIESALKEIFGGIMTSRENTATIIGEIIDFELEESGDMNIEQKLEVINQFRIHFKLVPDEVYEIEGEDNNVFMVEFSVGDFNLQGRYNLDTHLLTQISYVECNKTLEIRNLSIEISTENEDKLTEILNNPRMFFANANPAAYRKYQRMCE